MPFMADELPGAALPSSPVLWALCIIIAALVGLLALLGRAVLAAVRTGAWVPARQLDDAIKREERWEAAHGRSEAVREEQAQTIGQILDVLRGVGIVVAALPVVDSAHQREGG